MYICIYISPPKKKMASHIYIHIHIHIYIHIIIHIYTYYGSDVGCCAEEVSMEELQHAEERRRIYLQRIEAEL